MSNSTYIDDEPKYDYWQEKYEALRKEYESLFRLAKKVKDLRDAQNAHSKSLNYGYRNLAIQLGKEVDEMLEKLKIE